MLYVVSSKKKLKDGCHLARIENVFNNDNFMTKQGMKPTLDYVIVFPELDSLKKTFHIFRESKDYQKFIDKICDNYHCDGMDFETHIGTDVIVKIKIITTENGSIPILVEYKPAATQIKKPGGKYNEYS